MIRLLLLFLLWAFSAQAQSLSIGNGPNNAGFPLGAIITANSVTATTGGITLAVGAGPPGKFTYICGFSISPGSATAATSVTINLQNTPYDSANPWVAFAPVTAAGVTGQVLNVYFNPCITSNTPQQQVNLVVSALGAGGINQSAVIWGFYQ